MRARSTIGLVSCGVLFGLSYVLVRVVVPVLGPVGTTVGRTLIGGGTLLAIGRAGGQRIRWRDWPRYAVLGALSAAVPFSLISLSMLTLDAGSAAVLNASSPMFALAIDSVLRRRVPRWTQLLGLAVAAAGVIAVMSARGVHIGRGGSVGIIAGLTGAAVFALAAFYAGARFSDAPPVAVAAGQQLAACILLVPLLMIVPFPGEPSITTGLFLLALGFFGSATAYLLFYWLIASEGPAVAANVNLLVPAAGVLWGLVLLGEPVSPISVLGMVFAIGGLALILRGGATGRRGTSAISTFE